MIGNPLKVEDIISELGRGGMRLPEIQRKYVWVRSQVAKLLDSIYRGYPTGSLLLWDTTQEIIFKDLETRIGTNAKADFNPKVVLDGQQRITSLARVFDPSTARQDRIIFNVIDEIFESYSPRNASDPRWIDVTQLLANEVTELDVLDRLIEAGIIDSKDKALKNEVHERLKKLVDMRKYQYPVEIIREDDLEIVTEVFIRVNSGGTRLREAELEASRKHSWPLREDGRELPGTWLRPRYSFLDESLLLPLQPVRAASKISKHSGIDLQKRSRKNGDRLMKESGSLSILLKGMWESLDPSSCRLI